MSTKAAAGANSILVGGKPDVEAPAPIPVRPPGDHPELNTPAQVDYATVGLHPSERTKAPALGEDKFPGNWPFLPVEV